MKRQQPANFPGVLAGAAALWLLWSTAAPAQLLPGTVLWKSPVPGLVSQSCPAIGHDGTIYALGSGLTALAPDGTIKWATASEWGLIGSPVIADDGTIYFGNYSGTFHAASPDGVVKWSYDFQAEFTYSTYFQSTPALGADGTVYCMKGGTLFALTPDGRKKWQIRVDDGYQPKSPVIGADGTIYVTGDGTGYQEGPGLFAINPDATTKWKAAVSSTCEAAAIGPDGTIYATPYAFTPAGDFSLTGIPFRGVESTVLGLDGTLYCGGNGQLFSVSASGTAGINGSIGMNAWHWDGRTVPAVDASGMIYYYSSNTVFAVTPAGAVAWVCSGPQAFVTPWVIFTGIPTVGPDGTVYAAFSDGLYAIQGSGQPLAASGWPTFGQNLRHTGKVERPVPGPLARRSDGNFEIQFAGEPGQAYTVQKSADLANWVYHTNLVARGAQTVVADLTATNAGTRFYRVTTP